MTTLRIVKRYNNTSKMAGIEVADTVQIDGGGDACARFVAGVNASDKIDYEIIDYEVALISKMDRPEVITNPTGGALGKLMLPGVDYDGKKPK